MSSFIEPEAPTIDASQLGRLGVLANKQVEIEKEIAAKENEIKLLKKKLRVISQSDIPELMAEIGLESVTTEDGHQIAVKDIMTASISKERRPKAIAWLCNNDLQSLVSSDVVVSFEKGDESYKELIGQLANDGFSVDFEEKVNTASVKAAVKELLEQGAEVPFDVLGINLVKISTVK